MKIVLGSKVNYRHHLKYFLLIGNFKYILTNLIYRNSEETSKSQNHN